MLLIVHVPWWGYEEGRKRTRGGGCADRDGPGFGIRRTSEDRAGRELHIILMAVSFLFRPFSFFILLCLCPKHALTLIPDSRSSADPGVLRRAYSQSESQL